MLLYDTISANVTAMMRSTVNEALNGTEAYTSAPGNYSFHNTTHRVSPSDEFFR